MAPSRNGGSALGFSLFLAYIHLVCIGSDDSSDFQNSLPVRVIWAVPGKDAELPCDITAEGNDQVNMVLWFKDNIGIPVYSLDARGGPVSMATHWAMSNDLGSRTNFLIDKGFGSSRLKINRVTQSDEGIFRCRIDFSNSPTKNFKVNLTLIVQPSEPIVYDAQGREVLGVAGPFKEGYDLFLSCHVVGGRPRPKVTWWEGGQLLDSVMESITPTLVVNQYFRGKVDRSLYNTRVKCIAAVDEGAPPLTKEVRIEVYLKPREVIISTLSTALTSGRPHQYQCETWGSMPPAKVSWLLEGEPIRNAAVTATHDGNVTRSVLTYRPSVSDNGKELTCRAENPSFPGSILERNVELTVLHVPVATVKVTPGLELREGNRVEMLCQIDSNPEPHQISWFHGDRFLKRNESLGVLVTGRKLELLNLKREQAGQYSCSARNSVGEGRSENVFINLQYAPRCKEGFGSRRIGALRRDTVRVWCEVTADPADDVRFSWTFNKSGEVLPVQASRVSGSELSSHVEFTPVSDGDFGTLACWASNSIGRQAEPCMTHIFPAGVPEPPENCTLQNHTSGDVELICTPSYDGGLQQHFMLEVVELEADPDSILDDSAEFTHSKDPPGFKMLGSQPAFLLRRLQPGRSYRLSVSAINAKGRSDPPFVIPSFNIDESTAKLTSKEGASDSDEEARTNPMAIVLGTLIAVALLIVVGIAAAAGLVFCKSRTSVDGSTTSSNYDEKMKQAEARGNEETFVCKMSASKVMKMNNTAPVDPVLSEVRKKSEKGPPPLNVHKRNSANLPGSCRDSASFSHINNTEASPDSEVHRGRHPSKDTNLSSVNNLKNPDTTSRRNGLNGNGRRNHARVTLSPEGQVMRCTVTEGR